MSGGPRSARLSRRQWRWVKWAWGGLGAAVGLLSLLATMESEALSGNGSSWDEILCRPWQRLWSSQAEPVSLSELLVDPSPTPPAPAEPSTPLPSAEPSTPAPSADPLYVFMLDVSRSMRGTTLSTEEYQRFLRRATGEGPQGGPVQPLPSGVCDDRPTPKRLTSFEAAVIELCRYITTLPEGSRAALWTFGSAAQRIVPEPAGERRWVDVKPEANSDGRVPLRAALAPLDATDQHTDFEAALGTILDNYRPELTLGHEIHVVLVSDFVHDLGLGYTSSEDTKLPTDDQSRFLERQHAASMRMIERRFKLLSRAGAMFHLAAVVGTKLVSRSELALAGNSLEWRSYRVTRHETFETDFDFLRGYRTASKPLTFVYEPGPDAAELIELRLDTFSSGTGQAKVWIAGPGEGECPLKLGFNPWRGPAPDMAAPPRSRSDQWTHLTSRTEPEKIDNIGPGHIVGFKPAWPLAPFEAAKCALLVAVQADGGTPGTAASVTTAIVPIVFKRRLSGFGAVGMLAGIGVGMVSVLVLLAVFGFMGARSVWRRTAPLRAAVRARAAAPIMAQPPASPDTAVDTANRPAPPESVA